MPRAWLLLSFGDDRQYAGNPGYADKPRLLYRYDSFVPNHKQVSKGDFVLVRDHDRLQGIARIEDIRAFPGEKHRNRCPLCRTVALKERRTRHPLYRCDNGHEFDQPIVEFVACKHYEAAFGLSFVDTPGAVDIDVLRAACPRYSGQLAIQEVSLEPLIPRILEKFSVVASLLGAKYSEVAEGPPAKGWGPFLPIVEDARRSAQRLIRLRQGQRQFRKDLFERYGSRCLVSGCDLPDVVEAAHVDPYRGVASNHPENGLLLRTDLHTLFDLDLLGIEPETLVVRVNADVCRSGYERFEGERLLVSSTVRPSFQALRLRWLLFENRWRFGIPT
jgi:putative restriction endonuclease